MIRFLFAAAQIVSTAYLASVAVESWEWALVGAFVLADLLLLRALIRGRR